MKKSQAIAAVGLLASSLGSVAHADQLRVSSYDMDDVGGSVNVESDAALGEPWMRIEGRTVKIWFPHIDQVSKFDHERDSSEVIKALALRAGASDTGMLRLELGSQRHVNREDISIARSGAQATVRLRLPSPKPAVTFVDPQAARAAQPAAPAPAVQPPAAAAPAPQPLAAATPEPAPTPQPAAAAQPVTPLAAAGAKPDTTDALGALKDDDDKRTSPAIWLGLVSLVLGGAWAGLSLMQKKKPRRELPSIEVVGTRRLGHRQELMIVRALGSDHLLLCTNGRAECVASSPSPIGLGLPADTRAELPGAQESAPAQAPSQAGGIGIISRLSSQSRLRKLLDNVNSEQADDEDTDGAAFGEELASVTRKHRRPSLHSLPGPAAARPASDAVAGITRLRQRKSP